MKKTIILLCVVLLIGACSSHKAKKPLPASPPETEYLGFNAPAWLWQIPSGSYAVGFGFTDTFYSNRADSLAREFAAVSLSRNHSAFVVDKQAVYNWASASQSDWSSAGIKVVVSADMDYLKRANRTLKVIEAVDLQGYRIGLFGFIDGSVDNSAKPMRIEELPPWCVDESTELKGSTVICVASAVAASLPDAWNLAQEKALSLIGKYRIQKVRALFDSTDDIGQRRLAVETVTKNYKAYLDKSFIVPQRKEKLISYRVYIQLKSSDVQ